MQKVCKSNFSSTTHETTKESKYPLVSVVIANHNGENFIESCMSSLLKTDYPAFEVIFIDNASEDNSLKFARSYEHNPRFKLVQLPENIGTAAYNIGAKLAEGKYIAFLHVDQQVDPSWIKELTSVMENDATIGMAQCKIMSTHDSTVIDSAGCFMDTFGFVYQRGYQEKDEGQYSEVDEIFFAKNAGMIMRNDVANRVGVYDPIFFLWSEEVDLGWRVWLNGYRVIFVPSSVVYHDVGVTTQKFSSSFSTYHITKNRITMLIKNYEFRNLLLFLPGAIVIVLGAMIFFASKRQVRKSLSYIKGLFWVLINFRYIWQQRRYVQYSIRKVGDVELINRKKLIYKFNLWHLLHHEI